VAVRRAIGRTAHFRGPDATYLFPISSFLSRSLPIRSFLPFLLTAPLLLFLFPPLFFSDFRPPFIAFTFFLSSSIHASLSVISPFFSPPCWRGFPFHVLLVCCVSSSPFVGGEVNGTGTCGENTGARGLKGGSAEEDLENKLRNMDSGGFACGDRPLVV